MRLPAHIVLCCLLVVHALPGEPRRRNRRRLAGLHATPQGNAVYIEAKLNGHPATLLLDTGSTVSLCDWKLCGKAPKAASLELGSWHTDSEDIRPKDLSSLSLQAALGLTASWACSRWPASGASRSIFNVTTLNWNPRTAPSSR